MTLTPPDFDGLDLYDAGSIRRGRAYALEDRVTVLSNDRGRLRALCVGSGDATYLVEITWNDRGIVDDRCTCPLGGYCKHAVAVWLTARADGWVQRGPASWRRAFTGLLNELDPAAGASAAPLALQFEVRVPNRGHYGQGEGPLLVLSVLRWGRSQKWIKTGATWSDLASPYGPATEVDEAHAGVVRALMASGQIHSYQRDRHVALDRFGSDLWHHLERAAEIGVTLIGAGGDAFRGAAGRAGRDRGRPHG